MKSLEDEFREIENYQKWQIVYYKIRKQAHEEHDFSLTQAKKPSNKPYNRYRDVSPYDHSRVRLERGNIDYINASLVEVPEANRRYILAQGPLEITIGHFWQMVWEQNSKAIIMLTNLVERGARKCSPYYPNGDLDSGDDVFVCEDTFLKITCKKQERHSYYTVHTFELENLMTGKTKDVLHFLYASWSDFSVPQSPEAFLKFLHHVRKTGSLDPDVGPPIIHCSAGIGRSGTFCLVDSCLVLIKKRGTAEGLDIQGLLMEMRKYRMGLIQTAEQLRFSYIAVLAGARHILNGKGIDSIEVEDPPPEEPPPLPPRKRPHSPDEEEDGEPLNNAHVVPHGSQNNAQESQEQELRKRKRDEKKEELSAKVREMKEKLKRSESHKKTRSTFLMFGVGTVITSVVVLAAVYYYWTS